MVETKTSRDRRLSPLFTGSALLFVGTTFVNIGNYLFNFIMARLLTPANYGDMVALFAVGMILTVPSLAIVNIVARDTARLKGRGQAQEIASRLAGATRKYAVIGALLVLAFLPFVPLVAGFLNIDVTATVIYSLVLAFTFLVALNQGTLQGLQRFGVISAFLTAQMVMKIALGVALVVAGYQLLGAVWGVVLAQATLYLLTGAYLYRKIGWSARPTTWKTFTKENQLVVTGMLLLFLLMNLDLFFAKHFFSQDLAGAYAVLSTLGKIIIFATSSVAVVLLSMVSERVARRQAYGHLILQGLALVYLPGFLIAALYVFVPQTVIAVLFPGYQQVAVYLGLYGGLSLVLAVLNVMVHYFLAVREYRFIGLLLAANGLAVTLMLVWHQSFFRLIAAAAAAALVALGGSLLLLVMRGKLRLPKPT